MCVCVCVCPLVLFFVLFNMGHVFLLFACLVIINLMVEIVNFTLLSTGYFCIFINLLELCSVIQLLLENRLILFFLAFIICLAALKQCSV